MPLKKNYNRLTNRELDILEILWNSEQPLSASEIVAAGENEKLTVSTVQTTVRRLLTQGLIEIADIKYSGTVLCRTYRPTAAAKDKITSHFTDEFERFHTGISASALIASFLTLEKDPVKRAEEAQELEKFLDNYRKNEAK